jgi:hypothetical protein
MSKAFVNDNFMALDSLNNIYVAGNYSGTFIFNSDTIVNNSVPQVQKIFLCKISPTGQKFWLKQFTSSSNDCIRGLDIKGNNVLMLFNTTSDTVKIKNGPSCYVKNWGHLIYKVDLSGNNQQLVKLYDTTYTSFLLTTNNLLNYRKKSDVFAYGFIFANSFPFYHNIIQHYPSTYYMHFIGTGNTNAIFSQKLMPQSLFTFSAAPFCKGNNISLYDTSTIFPTSWYWSFPGGIPSSSNLKNPTVIFNTAGTFSVSLTASNQYGTGSIYTKTLTIYPNPVVQAVSTKDSICRGQGIMLHGTGASLYNWSNGITDGLLFYPSVSQTYTLTGTDTNGCTAKATVPIFMYASTPLSVNSGTICAGSSFTFTPTGASTYTYSSVSSVVSPMSTSAYTITGTDANNCIDTNIAHVIVNDLPVVNFNITPNLFCSSDTPFVLNANPIGGTFSGIGITSNQFNPNLAGVGTYTLNYYYMDVNNCSNSDTAIVNVKLCSSDINQLSQGIIETNIYPNPNNGTFYVTANQPVKLILITDVLGNEIQSVTPKNSTTTIRMNEQANGVYFVKIISDYVQIVKRLVIHN